MLGTLRTFGTFGSNLAIECGACLGFPVSAKQAFTRRGGPNQICPMPSSEVRIAPNTTRNVLQSGLPMCSPYAIAPSRGQRMEFAGLLPYAWSSTAYDTPSAPPYQSAVLVRPTISKPAAGTRGVARRGGWARIAVGAYDWRLDGIGQIADELWPKTVGACGEVLAAMPGLLAPLDAGAPCGRRAF